MRVLTIDEMNVVAGGCGAPKVKKPKKDKSCKASGKGSSGKGCSAKGSGKGSSAKGSGKGSSGKGCLPPPPPCEVVF